MQRIPQLQNYEVHGVGNDLPQTGKKKPPTV